MTDSGRFGDFVLLHRMASNELGERYRAASSVGGVLGDVSTLQLFTASGSDGPALARGARALPSDLEPILTPSRARAVGEVDGLPWAAYDHCQSFDLPTVLGRANGNYSALTLEQAALIAERLAKVLCALHRAGIAHGFVVPQLVSLSVEGEIVLLGCEHGPALAAEAVARRLDPSLGRYVAPEVRAGEPAQPIDDLFALGAIFFETLTGAPLVIGSDVAAQIQSARSNASDEVLPKPLRDLLAASLAPRSGRIADSGRWYGDLASWMQASGFALSNFDLAFLIHELFRDQLEVESSTSAEISVPEPAAETPSRPEPLPQPWLEAPAPQPSPAPAPSVQPLAPSERIEARTAMSMSASRGPSRRIVAGLAAALAIGIVGFGVYRWFGANAEPVPVTPPVPPAVQSAPPPEVDLAAAQAELERLVSERTSAVGKRLSDDYDRQLNALESEIEKTRADAEGVPPTLVSMPRPRLPGDVSAAERDSAVRVQVLVAKDGTVREARVPADGGFGASLSEAARSAALGARFSPATVAGAPAAQWTEVVVRFAS